MGNKNIATFGFATDCWVKDVSFFAVLGFHKPCMYLNYKLNINMTQLQNIASLLLPLNFSSKTRFLTFSKKTCQGNDAKVMVNIRTTVRRV